MEKLIAQKITEELSEYLVTKIIPGLEDLHNKNISYIDNYKKEYENWKKHLSSLSERSPVFMHTSNIYRQLEIKTNSHLAALQQQTIFDLYEDLEKRLLEMADTLDDNISVKQDSTLFVPDKENSLLLRIAKKLKYILFYISELTTRPLRKKGGRYYWNRKIPLRNLFTHYLIHNYLNMLLKNIEKYIDSSGQIFIKILNKQRNLDTLFINHHIKYLEEEQESNFEDAYPLFINKIDSANTSLND